MDEDNKKINNDNPSADEEVREVVPDEEENLPNFVSKIREKLKECEREKQEYLNGWQRTKADFVNFKKRSEEEKKEFIKFSNEKLIEEIIPTLESFEVAFSNKKSWESLPENWRKGMEYIQNQLIGTLASNGLKEINPPRGEKFNPSAHIAEVSSPTFDKAEDNVIIQVLKKGYSLNGRIVKAARVEVAEYKEGKAGEDGE